MLVTACNKKNNEVLGTDFSEFTTTDLDDNEVTNEVFTMLHQYFYREQADHALDIALEAIKNVYS